MSTLPVLCAVADACGGCPQIRLSEAEQRAGKLAQVAQSAAALGLVLPDIEWVTDGVRTGYRNRIRLRLDKGIPQFFNADKSVACAVLEPDLRDALPELRDWAAQILRSGTEAEREAWLSYSHLELRAPDADGTGSVCLFFPAGRGTTVSEPAMVRADTRRQTKSPGGLQTAAPVPARPSFGFRSWLLFAQSWPERKNGVLPPLQHFQLCDDVMAYVPVTSFMQINTGVNRLMVGLVRQIAKDTGAATFLDLFCGSGNLSLSLLKDGLTGAGAEIDPAAIVALKRAADEQGLDASRYVAGDARAGLFAGEPRPDLLITDPPRAGLRGEAAAIAERVGDTLLLCHCNLASFARDCAALLGEGLRLERVVAIDMFPHTAQLELLSVLRRAQRHD